MKRELRMAIPAHSTPTSNAAWGGPANEKRVRSDEDAAYYRKIYAWQDPEGDVGAKTSWRFIHHMVGADGEPVAANMRACMTAIAVLNGARGGTTIPEADRAAVHRHLAAHMMDGNMEPPELKRSEQTAGVETRFLPMEVRLVEENGKPTIVGHGAVFNDLSVPLGSFREKIAPGAFARALREKQDVRALFNHDRNIVLGRMSSGTLTLREDEWGLLYKIVPPDTQLVRDMVFEPIRRGDISGNSFSFRVAPGGDHWEEGQNEAIRTLLDVDIMDIGPVTFPAYPTTDVALRSLERWETVQRELCANPSLDLRRRRLHLAELEL